MRKIVIITLAATASLAAMSHQCAAAMLPGAAFALATAHGAAGAGARLVEPVTNVCGLNGCVRVQTQRIVKRRPPPPMPHQ